MANLFGNWLRFRKQASPVRKKLWVSNLEAIPSIMFSQLMGGPFLTGYLLYLGANSKQIGFVLAISALVNLIQIPMAVLMQKIRNRKVMVLLLATASRLIWLSVALIPLFVLDQFAVTVYTILFTLAFLFNGACGVVWASLMSDVVPVSVRGRFFGIRNAIVGALSSLALFIGGQILDAYPGGQGFAYVFIICAILVVFNTPIMFFYPNAPFEPSTETHPFRMLKKPFSDTAYVKSMLFIGVYVFILNITIPLFSYVMLDVIHLSYSWVSTIIVIFTLAAMTGNYVWGNLNARYSNQTLVFYSLPFIALGCLLWITLLFLPTLLVLILIHIVLGFGLAGFNQLVFNYVIGDTPKSERPMYIASFSAVTGTFTFLGPLLGGILYAWAKDEPNWIQLFGISTTVGVILLIYGFVVGRRVLRD
jgi:MFS family permease